MEFLQKCGLIYPSLIYSYKYQYTAPVGQFKPNALGLFDMSGNVWEWCYDWKGTYTADAQTNPVGAAAGSSRVLRGGSWVNTASNCRAAIRINDAPVVRSNFCGFRLVRD